MKRNGIFWIAGILLLAGLWYADTHLVPLSTPAGSVTPQTTRTPESTPTSMARSGPRAVVISLDGIQADRAQSYMADGTMPALAKLEQQGAMAQYALSVDPSLTMPALTSLATGAYPGATGVVSDRFHMPGGEVSRVVAPLNEPQAGAESVWRTAMREARRTAAVCWPGTDVDTPATMADYTVAPGAVDAPSAQHEVTLGEAKTWAGAPRSFSPLREGSLIVAKGEVPLATVYVLAVDTTDDEKVNYDTFVLSRTRTVGDKNARLRKGETAPLAIDDAIVSGAYLTLTQVAADKVTIYQSAVCYNRAQPNELVREVNRRFGFFPAGADLEALERGWITPEQYVKAAETQAGWINAVTRFVLDTYKPEVLFAAQHAPSDLQRAFLLVDAKQPKHTPELAAQYDRYVRRAYALADATVAEVAKALDLGQTALLVVSGYGIAPIHSQVHVNTILAAQGLLAYGGGAGAPIDVARSKAVAVASGASAHIYINQKGREQTGIVAEGDSTTVQDAIVKALQAVKDKDGQPVFSRVLRRSELSKAGLDAIAAGDVFVQAAPGYALADDRGYPNIISPASHYGERGFAADLPDMHGLFLAAGRGVRAGAAVGPVHIVDLAPTVDRILGLKPPTPRAGRVLEEVLLP